MGVLNCYLVQAKVAWRSAVELLPAQTSKVETSSTRVRVAGLQWLSSAGMTVKSWR